MDFLNLYRDHGVTLQHGGSDQWGNITGGVELIRRADGGHAHAFVTPLITKPDGTKYGKTEGDALWLDAEMMSPYAFHQWWLNVDDTQVGDMLRKFTFLTTTRSRRSRRETAEKPWLRSGQKRLADEVTTLVHGAEETEHAKAAAAALFGGGDLHALSPTTLAAALREAGSTSVASLLPVVDLLVETGLAKSKGEARRTISEGGAYLNNVRVEDPEAEPRDVRPDRRVVARAASGQEAVRGRRGRLRWTSSRAPCRRVRWLDVLRERARRSIPPAVWAYVQAGAGEGLTAAEANAAWRDVRFRTRVLRGVDRAELATTLLGSEVTSPIGDRADRDAACRAPAGRARHGRGRERGGRLCMSCPPTRAPGSQSSARAGRGGSRRTSHPSATCSCPWWRPRWPPAPEPSR